MRFAPATVHDLPRAPCGVFLAWLDERGSRLERRAERRTCTPTRAHLCALRQGGREALLERPPRHRMQRGEELFRFLYRRGYLLSDPAAGLEFPAQGARAAAGDPDPRGGAQDRGGSRRQRPAGLRDRAILETLLRHGDPRGRARDLTPDDVDTEERLLRVVRGKGRQGSQRAPDARRRPRRSRRTSRAAELALSKEREARRISSSATWRREAQQRSAER